MEFKIRKNISWYGIQNLIRYISLVLLPVLLAFHTFYFNEIVQVLFAQHHLMPQVPVWLWDGSVKFITYAIQIFINCCILLAITSRLRYALYFVYTACAALFLGLILVVLKDVSHLMVPASLIVFFVKLNKSFILLVLFIAGYIVQRSTDKNK